MPVYMEPNTFIKRLEHVRTLVETLPRDTLLYVNDHLMFGLGKLSHGKYVPFDQHYAVLGGKKHWRDLEAEAEPLCLELPDDFFDESDWYLSGDECWPEPDHRGLFRPNRDPGIKSHYVWCITDVLSTAKPKPETGPFDLDAQVPLPFTTGVL